MLSAAPFFSIGNVPIEMREEGEAKIPVVISTWNHGLAANNEAWKFLSKGKSALDAVEAGVRIPEADPEVTSVGFGGYPDATGKVTLDACIMDSKGNCGAVSYLEEIMHPISVARKVMEDTPHVMLSGKGAQEFALEKGFKKENLLSPKAKQAWEQWKQAQDNKINVPAIQDHDTIGMLAVDEDGEIAGACTTSGLAWKLNGRVGDSPIIGAGLFVDGKVGGATATGKGEAVIKIAGTAIIVELMRMGKSPQEACEMAVQRIMESQPDHRNFQVGFLALNLKGEYGACSLQDNFDFALSTGSESKLIRSKHLL